jgi:hypothetical protein
MAARAGINVIARIFAAIDPGGVAPRPPAAPMSVVGGRFDGRRAVRAAPLASVVRILTRPPKKGNGQSSGTCRVTADERNGSAPNG